MPEAKFISYKESTGNAMSIEIDPGADKELIAFLQRHGCSDFALLDADKNPI